MTIEEAKKRILRHTTAFYKGYHKHKYGSQQYAEYCRSCIGIVGIDDKLWKEAEDELLQDMSDYIPVPQVVSEPMVKYYAEHGVSE
jgi:hypothetical protein